MIESLNELALRSGMDILAKAEEIHDGSTVARPTLSLIEAFGGRATASGVRVTPDSAMRATAVNACVRAYAETVATVPLHVYRRRGKSKDRATDRAIYSILHDRPNAWMSSYEWRELMERHRCLRGNAYSLIERNGRGDVTGLYPLNPARVTVLKGADRLPYYRCDELAGAPVLPHTQVFHLRNLTADGYVGKSYIEEAMDSVGLTLALEEFGGSLFANGANMRGFFKYNAALTPDQYRQLREKFEQTYAGLRNANRPGLLDGQWDWVATSMKAEEAQFLESRAFQIEDIARLFRMPAVMIGHSDKAATYASAEQFFLSFVVYTILPVTARWAGAINRSLFTDQESDLFSEFLLDGLLKGDIKSRYAAYAVARQWGWMCADDIRERENMDPLPEGKGEIFLEPLNMIEAGTRSENPPSGQSNQTLTYLDAITQILRNAAPQLEATDEN